MSTDDMYEPITNDERVDRLKKYLGLGPNISHKILLEIYIIMFNINKDDIELWFPNGKGSIRVRLFSEVLPQHKIRQEVIFTFYSADRWSLETLQHFLKKKKEERKKK